MAKRGTLSSGTVSDASIWCLSKVLLSLEDLQTTLVKIC